MVSSLIISNQLRFAWKMAALGAVISALYAWYFYEQLAEGGLSNRFLFSLIASGTLGFSSVVLFLFHCLAKRIMDFSHRFTDWVDRFSWNIIGVVTLVLVIGGSGFFLLRYRNRAATAFDLLHKDELLLLEERIREFPALLEQRDPESGLTLFETAYQENRPQTMALLLANAADGNVLKGIEKNLIADSLGKLPMLNVLLGSGMDPNAPDTEGLRPIHHGAAQTASAAIALLVDAGADVDGRDRNSRTALMIAAKRNELNLINKLINLDAQVNARNQQGDTPLHYAVLQGTFQTVRQLLDSGADPWLFNSAHMTPLHIIAQKGRNELLSIFLKQPDMIDLCTENGPTPLGIALKNRQTRVAERLIAAGADINWVSAQGDTLLHEALLSRDYPTVRFLLHAGAKTQIPNAQNETAYDIMRRKHLTVFLELADGHNVVEGTQSSPNIRIPKE